MTHTHRRQTQRTILCNLVVLGLLSQSVSAQPAQGSPKSESPGLLAPVGFQVDLLRSGAELGTPVALEFDDSGRAWVAAGDGRIIVLERESSAAGQGAMADTVFATGLRGLSAFALHRDGVIAAVETGIVWLRDEDGDGRAESTTQLFSGLEEAGWVIRDLSWGLDGWVYGALDQGPQGTVGPWRVRGMDAKDGAPTVAGLLTGGLFRVRLASPVAEQVVALESGATSLAMSWDGELFFSMPGTHAAHVVMPAGGFASVRVNGAPSWSPMTSQSVTGKPGTKRSPEAGAPGVTGGGVTGGGGTEGGVIGAAVYGGGAWPTEYANSFFVASGASVRREPFLPVGSSFQVRKRPASAFLSSRGGEFLPVDLAEGPGAALYVLDGDARGGRLWRVRHSSQSPAASSASALPRNKDAGELVAELGQPSAWRRWRAHRRLAETGLSKENALELARRARNATEPWIKIHALWLGAGGSELLSWGLGDYSPSVRRNALLVAAAYGSQRTRSSRGFARSYSSRVPESSIMGLTRDGDARVRLAALLAWSSVVGSVHLSKLVPLYPKLTDDWSRSVVLEIAARHPVQFIQALFREGKEGALVGLARGVTDATVRGGRGGDAVGLLLRLTEGERSPRLVAAVLDGLAQAPDDVERPWPSPRLTRALRQLANSKNEHVALAALPLAERWAGDQIASSEVAAWIAAVGRSLEDSARSLELRITAVRTLLAIASGRETGLEHAEVLVEALERGALKREQLTRSEVALLLDQDDAALASRARKLLE